MRRILAKGLLIGAFLLWAGTAAATDANGTQPGAAAIASAHPLATAAGLEILAAGGNAFDAAVAVSAALAVVEPYSSGLGGGGFWLLHRAADGFEVMLDGRERAPLAAHRDLYLDAQGEVVSDWSMNGPLSAAIPGEPAALDHLARHYGKLPLARSLAPAIRLARGGFAVDEHYRSMAEFRLEVMARYPETATILLDHGAVPEAGESIVQEDLARTLEALAEQGAAGFYRGPVAQRLVEAVRAAGGIWTRDDLEQYRVVEREPVQFRYRDLKVTTASPPSSGGVALATMLHILEGHDLAALDAATRTHLVLEAMRRAYRDRAEYLGDPDFVDMPLARLTSPDYAAGLRASIRADRATPSADLPGTAATGGGHHTTHFSILDREGNRVAATLSVNYPFGSGFIAAGTGVLLNDEMDDFSAKPGVPNAYGLVGAEANAIAPGKRPLSSMSPTFVETTDRVAILGTPGGSRIITMVLLGILDFARDEPPESWVTRPRFHHQFLPDLVEYEAEALSKSVIEALQARGHVLKAVRSPYGNMQAVLWDRRDGKVRAAADPRGLGAAEVR
ncbi:MAG: gamma-glutamyltransferase [Xanthomonadaceae bacterium]|nr:gamma-glutamyltransferase [Xanthomonadaceae bacterium]